MLPDINAKRILLVESSIDAVTHLTRALRAAGYSVETAYNAGDALAVDPSRYTLALINPQIEDRSGRSLFDLFRSDRRFSHLRLINLDEIPPQPDSGRLYDDSAVLSQIGRVLNGSATSNNPSLVSQVRPLHETKPIDPPPGTGELRHQLAALKAVSALGRSISSVLDLNQVLNQIVDAATTLTGAEEGMLLLPDEEDKALYLRAMKGIDDKSAQNFRIRSDDSLVMRVYRTGEPVVFSDEGELRIKTEYFVKSMLYVPLQYKGQTIGVLGINNRRRERIFTTTDQELLLDLAAHAATAIENARLYEARLLQNRQLVTLVESGNAVNSTLALPDVLMTIVRQVVSAFDANGCLIQQIDPTQEVPSRLLTLARAWHAVWRLERGPTMNLEARPMLRHAINQSAFYVASRDQSDPQWQEERDYLSHFGAEHLLVLPLRTPSNVIIGVAELFFRKTMPDVTQEYRSRARTIAMETCAQIPERHEVRPPSIIFASAQQLLESTGADWCFLSLLRGEKTLERVVEYGAAVFLDEPHPEPDTIQTDLNLAGDGSALINHHQREKDLPPAAVEMLRNFGAGAILSMPLPIKGRSFGVFTIYSTLETRRFSQDEISLAWALITQAATAIENARLYRDLEHSLTDLKHAQASLVQAARLSTMGQLAAVVAHQINNPLTTIMVDSEILLQDLPPDSTFRESVIAIHRAGKRAHAVVKRLLSTARRSSPTDERQLIDIHVTIRNTLDLILAHIERSKIKLEADLAQIEKPLVLAAPGHLEDVWLNLLLNGRDAVAGQPNPRLGISTTLMSDNHLAILVWDNGKGIPQEHLSAIFEPFFTTKPAGEGTGLGLYICKQIIEQCYGKIEVESEPGQGAVFKILLPLARSAE